jgi:hypothetical protein
MEVSMTTEFDARMCALLERMDLMLTALDKQLAVAIEQENTRLTAIEARLAGLEENRSELMRRGLIAKRDYTDRDPAKAMVLLNRDG